MEKFKESEIEEYKIQSKYNIEKREIKLELDKVTLDDTKKSKELMKELKEFWYKEYQEFKKSRLYEPAKTFFWYILNNN
ncbi:MAG: hypothetical protein LBC61_07080 [Candidatus Peribacteria bacterium]|nr:hypothetical protein [Candidatus Peribacteria bacterium]